MRQKTWAKISIFEICYKAIIEWFFWDISDCFLYIECLIRTRACRLEPWSAEELRNGELTPHATSFQFFAALCPYFDVSADKYIVSATYSDTDNLLPDDTLSVHAETTLTSWHRPLGPHVTTADHPDSPPLVSTNNKTGNVGDSAALTIIPAGVKELKWIPWWSIERSNVFVDLLWSQTLGKLEGTSLSLESADGVSLRLLLKIFVTTGRIQEEAFKLELYFQEPRRIWWVSSTKFHKWKLVRLQWSSQIYYQGWFLKEPQHGFGILKFSK